MHSTLHRVKAEPAGPTIEVGDGWKVPSRITVTADHGEFAVRIEGEYRDTSGRYEVDEVAVSRRGDGEVTGLALRQVPVAAILRQGVVHIVTADAQRLLPGPDPREVAAQGPTDATLREVARWYRFATLLGDPPAQRVAEALGVSRSLASNWAIRARDRGYLTVQDPRGGRRA